MTYLYFIATYGLPLLMMLFAYAMEPKPKSGNSGVRL